MFQTVQRQLDHDGETVLGYRVTSNNGTTARVPIDSDNRDFQRVQDWITQNGDPEDVTPPPLPTPYDVALLAIDSPGVESPWAQAAFRETALQREFGVLPSAATAIEAETLYRQQARDWLVERKSQIEGTA